jgi:hypothetical protein
MQPFRLEDGAPSTPPPERWPRRARLGRLVVGLGLLVGLPVWRLLGGRCSRIFALRQVRGSMALSQRYGEANLRRRAAAPEEASTTYGGRKDRSWQGPGRGRDAQAGVAPLIRAALERAGHEGAISHASLPARGHACDAGIDTKTQDQAQGVAECEVLHREAPPWENDLNLLGWPEQKPREGSRDRSREASIDHVRDRFWRHDKRPARAWERAESLLRALDRESARTGRDCTPVQPRASHRGRSRGLALHGGRDDSPTAVPMAPSMCLHWRRGTPEVFSAS